MRPGPKSDFISAPLKAGAKKFPFVRQMETGVVLRLHVIPKSSRTSVCGIHGDALKIKVQAPPVDGAANKAVQKFLAKTLKVAKSSVQILSGASSRQKEFLIKGINFNDLHPLLSCLP